MSLPRISVSIVSHGQALILGKLPFELINSNDDIEVILTINSPRLEPDGWMASLSGTPRLKLRVNEQPKSFAANHNSAAQITSCEFFCVMNPDISVATGLDTSMAWAQILTTLKDHASSVNTGLAYPVQIDTAGETLDFERILITPYQIACRYLFPSGRLCNSKVDWVSGACLMFQTKIFKLIGGFDQGFRLYCEDVDICLRLQLAGYKLIRAPCTVVHDTQRDTLKSRQHLIWHVQSMIKLWFSKTFWNYLQSKIRFIPFSKD